jgi:pyruvate carboxylase
LIDTTPELFKLKPRRDRATKLLAFIADVTVNGNPHAKGYVPKESLAHASRRTIIARRRRAAPGSCCWNSGRRNSPEWTLKQKQLLITSTTFRDAHQSLFATRMRTYDILTVADASRAGRQIFTAWKCGAGRRSTPRCASCMKIRGRGCGLAREDSEHLFPDAVPRLERGRLLELSRQRRRWFREACRGAGMDIFRIFDSLNYLPNLKVAMEAVNRKRTRSAKARSVTPATFLIRRSKYSLKYYVKLAKELEKMGAHMLAIKDMAGLCKAGGGERAREGAEGGGRHPDSFPHARHQRHRGGERVERGGSGRGHRGPGIASMSGSTSQPNMNSIVAALQFTKRDRKVDLDTLNEFSDYWEQVRTYYAV